MALARSNIRAPNSGAKSTLWSALCLQSSMAFNNSFSVSRLDPYMVERPLDDIELVTFRFTGGPFQFFYSPRQAF